MSMRRCPRLVARVDAQDEVLVLVDGALGLAAARVRVGVVLGEETEAMRVAAGGVGRDRRANLRVDRRGRAARGRVGPPPFGHARMHREGRHRIGR
eukprot:3062324-Pleurochrysis_carterae.AAC.1